jgi:hypothetical protein
MCAYAKFLLFRSRCNVSGINNVLESSSFGYASPIPYINPRI